MPLEDRVVLSLTLSAITWTAVGPAPITGGQVPGAGPVSGRVTGIAIDTGNPSTNVNDPGTNPIFIATAGGGVWKTTDPQDASPVWKPLTDNLFDSSGNPIPMFMGAIAETRDASNKEVIYAGLGEANNSDDNYYGEGILVSHDGGASWALTGQTQLQGTAISRIAIDPQDPNTAYVAVSNGAFNGTTAAVAGIYKTTTGGLPVGATSGWQNVTAANGQDNTKPWSDVVIDPTTTGSSAVLFAAVGNATGSSNNGVYTSVDGGSHWALVGGGLPGGPGAGPNSGPNIGRISLAIARPSTASPAVLYASIATPTASGKSILSSLQQSTDGGMTWSNITASLNGDDYLNNQGQYDNVIEINPTNTNEVFAAGVTFIQGPATFSGGGIVESQDGGKTWTDGTTHPQIVAGTAGTNGPHTDYHALAFDGSGRIVVGNDGGVWRLDSNSYGAVGAPTNNVAWTDLNGNLATITFTGIAPDPTNTNIAYGGSQDNGTEKFTGSDTLSWGRFADTPAGPFNVNGDGGITRVDPTNPSRIYVEQAQDQKGVVRLTTSPTGAAPFTSIGAGLKFNKDFGGKPKVNFYAPYVLDSAGDVLFGTDYLNISADQGNTWSQIGVPPTPGSGGNTLQGNDEAIQSIAVAPSNSSVVYVSVGGKMFVTQNATAVAANAGTVTWTEIDLSGGASASGASALNSITVDPTNPGVAYAVTYFNGASQVFKTTNFGADNWTALGSPLPNTPVNAVAVGPDLSTLFVGTDTGVYVTHDNGQTWYNFSMGLPNVQVVDLEYVPTLNVLAAGTHGRGMYEILVPPDQGNAVVGIDSPPTTRVGPPSGHIQGGRLTSPPVTFEGHSYSVQLDGSKDILLSMDGGTAMPIGEVSAGGAAPSLAVFNGQLYIAWRGTDNHVNVGKVALRPDGQATGISGGPRLGYTTKTTPTLVSIDNSLILSFTGQPGGSGDEDRIFFDFINAGLTNGNSKPNWGGAIPTSEHSPPEAGSPDLYVDNDQVFVTWEDNIDAGLGEEHTAQLNLVEQIEEPLTQAFDQPVFVYNGVLYINGANGALLDNAQIVFQSDGPNLQVLINGLSQFDASATTVKGVRINGGNDTLNINFANGNPFPNGVSIDGITTPNTLGLEGTSSFVNEVETPTSPTSGTIVFDSNPAIVYNNVATVDDTTTISGTATFKGTSAAETINASDGGSVDGVQTTRLDSGSSVTFATVFFANKPTVIIDGVDGADTVNLDNPNPAAGLTTLRLRTGTDSGNTFNVQVTAVTTDLVVGASATVNVGSKAPAAGGVVDGIRGALAVVGDGSDTLNVDDTGSTGPKTGTLTATTITGLGMGPDGITYSGLAALNVNLGSGGNTFTIQAVPAGLAVRLDGGDGNNRLLGPDAPATWSISGANAGSVNGITFNSFENLTGGSAADRFVFLSGGGVAGNIDGGGGSNTLDYSHLTTPVTIGLQGNTATGIGGTFAHITNFIGGSGSNTVVGPNADTVWTLTGLNTFTVDGLSFSAFQNLTGGSGADRFVFQTGGGVSGTIDGGGGNNTLDYSGYVGNVNVDLALGTATGVGIGVRHVEKVTGSIGNDLLVGDALPNTLVGGTGRNVIIGGAGADDLTGGGGDNIIIGGSTAYDTNLTALAAIMAEWARTDLSFEQRLADLISNAPPARALNGPYHLNKKTVFDDNAANVLTGGGGLDWFFVGQDDIVLNRKPRDHITGE